MHNRQQAVGQPALDMPRQIEHRVVARADRAAGPAGSLRYYGNGHSRGALNSAMKRGNFFWLQSERKLL
jgi:hypothetical protein